MKKKHGITYDPLCAYLIRPDGGLYSQVSVDHLGGGLGRSHGATETAGNRGQRDYIWGRKEEIRCQELKFLN